MGKLLTGGFIINKQEPDKLIIQNSQDKSTYNVSDCDSDNPSSSSSSFSRHTIKNSIWSNWIQADPSGFPTGLRSERSCNNNL